MLYLFLLSASRMLRATRPAVAAARNVGRTGSGNGRRRTARRRVARVAVRIVARTTAIYITTKTIVAVIIGRIVLMM